MLRILARLRADDRDILDVKVKKSVEEDLMGIMPADRPGDFNQALMELGAMVCIPNGAPKCEVCPWETICQARARKSVEEYPRKTPKKPRHIEEKTILVIQDANLVALRKRPDKGLLAGMYEFPSLEGNRDEKQVIAYLRQLGLSPIRIQKLAPAKHVFTHKEWHMTGYVVRVDELSRAEGQRDKQGLIFIDPEETKTNYPIPSAFAVYAEHVEMNRNRSKK